MCYSGFLYPSRIVRVVPYFWNKKCLEAPKPYMVNGIYDINPCRRVRPGLLPVPQGFTSLADPETTTAILKKLLKHYIN